MNVQRLQVSGRSHPLCVALVVGAAIAVSGAYGAEKAVTACLAWHALTLEVTSQLAPVGLLVVHERHVDTTALDSEATSRWQQLAPRLVQGWSVANWGERRSLLREFNEIGENAEIISTTAVFKFAGGQETTVRRVLHHNLGSFIVISDDSSNDRVAVVGFPPKDDQVRALIRSVIGKRKSAMSPEETDQLIQQIESASRKAACRVVMLNVNGLYRHFICEKPDAVSSELAVMWRELGKDGPDRIGLVLAFLDAFDSDRVALDGETSGLPRELYLLSTGIPLDALPIGRSMRFTMRVREGSFVDFIPPPPSVVERTIGRDSWELTDVAHSFHELVRRMI